MSLYFLLLKAGQLPLDNPSGSTIIRVKAKYYKVG